MIGIYWMWKKCYQLKKCKNKDGGRVGKEKKYKESGTAVFTHLLAPEQTLCFLPMGTKMSATEMCGSHPPPLSGTPRGPYKAPVFCSGSSHFSASHYNKIPLKSLRLPFSHLQPLQSLRLAPQGS